jgi:phosphate transport system protein
MRNKFDEQLENLNLELIKMGALCEDAITASMRALLDGDNDMIIKTTEIEKEIDDKERYIEALCMKLLLKQQPVASDLRLISSALKMISDMERIGDQAADIAEITKFIKNNNTKSIIHIKDMADAAIKMVTDSIDSYVKKDLSLAKYVMQYDDVVDKLFSEVRKELIVLVYQNQRYGELCLDILMIAKYLERIGDHAVNIAEWVEYSITGNHKSYED